MSSTSSLLKDVDEATNIGPDLIGAVWSWFQMFVCTGILAIDVSISCISLTKRPISRLCSKQCGPVSNCYPRSGLNRIRNVCLSVRRLCARLFICALWSPAGKGLTSWLSFVVSSVSLSLSHWYPGSGVVLDCIDSWSLQPYYFVANSLDTNLTALLGTVWSGSTAKLSVGVSIYM